MYPCKVCPFTGTQNNALKKHMSENHRNRELQCDTCSYFTQDKNCLKRHKEVHEGLKVPCHICNKQLSVNENNRSLNNHMTKWHSGNQRSCDVCKEEFENYYELRLHRRTYQNFTLG